MLIFIILIYSILAVVIIVCIKDKSCPSVNNIDKFDIIDHKPEGKDFLNVPLTACIQGKK
jgi:hypothetical protein